MSETVTMTITDFLLARIARDEAAALGVEADNFSRGSISTGDDPWRSERVFAERFTPARVLADCEAKRKIVELADEATGLDVQVDGEFRVGDRDEDSEPYVGDLILRALALPFADHEDYRPEWAP